MPFYRILAYKGIGGTAWKRYPREGNMTDETNGEIIAFGMTRQVVIDAVSDIEKEYTGNKQDSSNCSEYAQHMREGREALKKQVGYYPYLPREEQ
jgi:hypothetical protein